MSKPTVQYQRMYLLLDLVSVKEIDNTESLVFYIGANRKVRHFSIRPEDIQLQKVDDIPQSKISGVVDREARKKAILEEALQAYGIEATEDVRDEVAIAPKREVQAPVGYEPEDSSATQESDARAQAEITRLGLQTRKVDPLRAILRINDDAGPDGSELTLNDARSLAELCYSTKVDKSVNQAAFARLAGLPMSRLVKIRPGIPRELAMHIARVRCANLGASPQGVGANYIPPSWTSFIEGDPKYADNMIDDSGQSIPIAPPPVENFEVIKKEERFLSRQATLQDVETRFAGMTFRGTESL